MASSVEQELWHCFSFYTLHGNPLDPEHMRSTQFVKMCRDCQIIGATLSEADPPLGEADVQVCYTAEVRRVDKRTEQKMHYGDFLTALMKLSIKVYPRSRTVDDAFQRLLMENILPLSSRRCPEDIRMFLENEDVQRLYDYYADALEQIFQFYATADKRSQKAMVAHAMATGTLTGPYMGTGSVTVAGKSPGRATRSVNTMTGALGYGEFLKFATDFDLSSSVILSTLELGDIYLSSMKTIQPEASIRKLTFVEFWEVLIRCALVAYSKISDATIIDKIRGLFLYMWRAMNRSVPRAFSERRNVSTYAGDLLAGAMLFNKRFTAAWAADAYRDYLSPEVAPLESGKAVLTRLLRKGGGGVDGALGLPSASPSGSPSRAGFTDAYEGIDAHAEEGSDRRAEANSRDWRVASAPAAGEASFATLAPPPPGYASTQAYNGGVTSGMMMMPVRAAPAPPPAAAAPSAVATVAPASAASYAYLSAPPATSSAVPAGAPPPPPSRYPGAAYVPSASVAPTAAAGGNASSYIAEFGY